jgi:hypothetical protein
MGARAGLVQKKVRVKTKRGVAMRTMWVKSNPKAAVSGKKLRSGGSGKPMGARQFLKAHGGTLIRNSLLSSAAHGAGLHQESRGNKKIAGGLHTVGIGNTIRASFNKKGRKVTHDFERASIGAKLAGLGLTAAGSVAGAVGGYAASHGLHKGANAYRRHSRG